MKYTIDCSKGVAISLEPPDRVQEVIQSIFILLNTMKGEIPCYRDFGVDGGYLHKPMKIAQTMYVSTITEQVERYVPGVQIDKIRFHNDPQAPTTLIPILEVTIYE